MISSTAKRNLRKIHQEIETVILSRQNPITGLLPASTAVNSHGDYTDAWVRDNVYSIIAPWALAMAYRKSGNTQSADEIEQSVVKLMRGLLQSMMRQANKVERFKHTLNPIDSLHAKYSTHSGLTVVADDGWGHLQIDATSIFLLMLAQMTRSGLRIICTLDEVDFVQNLIYYISSAYRTPDYGIWERGNKINNGKTEINASSLGMAKAALQALDGLNLFGENGSTQARVHTVPDALSMARTNLAALLPRESLSKEVDSAILSIIGFPAFAVGDSRVATKTRDDILKKLGGDYGLKRFLWDGHQTTTEDPHRLYYEHSELANFEHIESEWPLFFCYLYINALFSKNAQTAKHYREKIESLMVEKDGIRLIPELYYVPETKIEAEKAAPRSQAREPNDNLPLVWAQSLYYTALMMDEGYIDTDDLDPCGLRAKTTQFSRAQVALVVLAENKRVKKILSDNGVIAERIEDILPIRVVSAPHLVEAYSYVGANEKLQLSGRPKRRLLSLATSQTYNINDQQYLCLSWIQGAQSDDYSLRDPRLVAKMVAKEISHIRNHWLNSEVAVFTFMVSEDLALATGAEHLMTCLKNYQLRTTDEYIGYASASLAYLASRENQLHIENMCINPIADNSIQEQPKTNWNESAQKLLAGLTGSQEESTAIIYKAFEKQALDAPAGENVTWHDLLDFIYLDALARQQWIIVRLIFSLSNRRKLDLSDCLSVLSTRHFSINVGSSTGNEFSLHPSLDSVQIYEILSDASQHPVELSLLQEVLDFISVLQRTRPQMFEGLRSIQLHHILKLCSHVKAKQNHLVTVMSAAALSPSELMEQITHIVESLHSRFSADLQHSFTTQPNLQDDDAADMNWFEWRFERGLILGLNREFLEKVWQTLSLAPQIIFGDSYNPSCVINSTLVQNSMTPGEENFARLIDNALNQVHPPYFKSALTEVLSALTEFHATYPAVSFQAPINLETILEQAAKIYCELEHQSSPSQRDIDIFLEESPKLLAKYFMQVLINKARV